MSSRAYSSHATYRPSRPRTSLLGAFEALLGLARQRRDLAQLDDRALEDIGVTRSAAQTEAERPIWDVPSHWSN